MSPVDPTSDSFSPEGKPSHLSTAAVAHDLNQMLAVISGRLGLLLAQTADEEVSRHLRAMDVACRDAATLVRRLSGPAGAATPGSCDVIEEARQVVELVLGGQASGAGVAAEVVGDGVLPAALPGQALREVLVNLLFNAREAMGGRGTILITGRRASDRVFLTVADTGPGVAPDIRQEIFLPGRTSREGGGRGIGLAGCRDLLAGYGCRLDLEDSAEPGAVFVLDMPAAVSVPARKPVPAGKKPGKTEVDPWLRVLVVDDEPAMRDMLHEVLPTLGCEVSAAGDAESARREFQSGAFEVALLDENLPGDSGTRLAADLRRDDPCLAVILMSGWGQDMPAQDTIPEAVDFVVRKPMEFPQLQRILMEAVRLHSGRTASRRHED